MAQSHKGKQKMKVQTKSTKKVVNKASKKAKSKKITSPPKHKKKQVAKSHKSKISQARSVEKKVKVSTNKKLTKKTQVSKAKKVSSKKAVVKAKKTKAAKPKSIKKSTLIKVSQSGKSASKKAVTTTQKKDSLTKPVLSQVKDKLKKKEPRESKSRVIDKSSKKVAQKNLSKKGEQSAPSPAKPLISSQPKAKFASQQDKETFYDVIEAAFHDEQVVLTNAEGKQFCHHKECDQVATTGIYCRHHYISLWDLIQRKKKILEGGKLEKFIQEITSRYPDKFLDMMRKNLSTERDFTTTLHELEIAHASDHTSDYQDSHKDINSEEEHLPFSDDRSET